MTYRAALPIVSAVLMGLASPATAFDLASANAVPCGSLSGKSAATQTGASDRDETQWYKASYEHAAASTVKLRILYEKGNRVEVDHCGGTVIDSQWIVTAGHCVAADSSWNRIEIVAGDQHLDGHSAITRSATDAICHAGFRYETLENDVALIRLDKPLPPRITAMKLDDDLRPSVRPGDVVKARGWPVTGMRAGDRMMNRVSLQVRNIDLRSYITATSVDGRQAGLCRGESGGPLVSPSGKLAGVLSGIQPGTSNSMGEECMLSGYEMYFTPVASYRGWIDRVKSICSANPASCSSTGAGMMLASTPQRSYGGGYAQAAPQQDVYWNASVQVAAAQPGYINIGPINGGYGATPTYIGAQPSYAAPGTPAYVDSGVTYGLSNGYMGHMTPTHGFLPGHMRETD